MNLVEVTNRTRAAVDDAAVSRLVAAVLDAEGVRGAEVAVEFVGERRIRALNREHRGKDEVTDVLSFPLEDGPAAGEPPAGHAVAEDPAAGEAGPPRLLGDIVICARRALRQARGDDLPAALEFAVLLAHGTLHLLGYDHETDAGQMALRQAEVLETVDWEGSLSRRGNLLSSFNFAFDGIVHALRYERNMWIHFGIAALVLIASLFFALTRLEVIALLVAISFVLITEMFNTALEHVVDLITDEDDPRARVAKDVAAGAVLIAAVNAVAVAYLVFYDKITSVPYTILSKLRGSPIDVAVIALFIVALAAIALKALTHRGTAFHGGLPSVHAALAFAAWVAVTFVAASTTFALPISAITLFLALLVSQSRVQAGIHSLAEVAVGAALGIAITALLFRIWYPI